MLHLSLLGPLKVKRDGSAVSLPQSRKCRALLAYLVVSDSVCQRDDLCHLLWEVPDDPRAALRWSLSKLRLAVNNDSHAPLLSDRNAISLDRSLVDVDLDLVREISADTQASSAQLEKAWQLAGQGLLVDCDLPSQVNYTEWLTSERAALRALKADLAQRLSDDISLSQQQRSEWAKRWQRDAASTAANRAVTEQSVDTPQPHQEVRFIQVHDNTNIAWAEVGVGKGPTLIKAANWLSHLELDWKAPIWSPLFHNLAKDHHVIRYDERGCGLSDWNVDDISFESFVSDLEHVVEASGAEKFVLLGISQGAAVSIEYAARHPERVSKLILFGGYPVGWRAIASEQEQREREAIMVLTASGWGRPDPSYRRLFSQTFMPEATRAELDWFDEFQRSTTSPENAVRFLEAFANIDVRERLKELKVPTLVLHSRGDRRIPHDTGRSLAAQIAGARLNTLESNSHLLLGREPAAQDFVNSVREFLLDIR